MKEIIILTVIALFATAWVYDSGARPQPVKVGVLKVASSETAGVCRKDEMIGDFKLVDGYRVIKIRSMVYDDHDPKVRGKRNDSDFPLSGTAI